MARISRCAREAEPSDALRQQTDPLEPAGRRFANFFFDSSFERFSQRRCQPSDPQSDRLAGAACWPPSPVPEFGLGLVRPPRRRIRWCGRRRRASAARYGVDFDTTPIEAALIGGACSRSRNGSEASAERGGVYLIGANFSRARARRSRATRSASRPTRSSRLGGASPISFSTVLLRDFPSDVGQPSDPQSDRLAGAACWPPSPVPEFGLGLVRPPRRRIRWCGRRRRASAARYGVDFDTTPIEAALIGGACSRSRNGSEASAERGGVYLIGANFSRARARRSRATRSASRPTRSSRLGGASPISFSTVLLRDFPSDVGQPSDPQSDRLAGAACWPPSPVPEFGLGLVRPPRRRIRWCGRRRRASAARYGVDFDTTPIEAALIGGACSRSRNGSEASAERGGVYLIGANFSRARARRSRATRSASRPTRSSRLGGASPISFSTVLLRDFPSDVGQPSDPQSDRLAGAACWPPSPVPEFGLGLVRPPRRRIRWCGRRRRASAARYGVDFDTTPIEAALIGGACSRSRNGSEASAERGGVYLIGANFSRARARRSRATRSASRPTRSSRLGGASPI